MAASLAGATTARSGVARLLAKSHSAALQPPVSPAVLPAGRVPGCSRVSACPTKRRRSTALRARCSSSAAAEPAGAQAPAMAQPFTIVGGGRIGNALVGMGGGQDVLVRRGEQVTSPAGPIIVCTRNDDLQAVVDATPPERRPDLVFIQNGMLQPWLDARGLGDNTQVLVYFAVAKKGDAPIDGKTDVNPEGLTAATGRHAQAFADRLAAGGLACKVLDRTAFQKSMLEKLVWISAVMLVGVRHKASVGQVEQEHRDEAVALMRELGRAGARALGITLDAGMEERLLAYCRAVASYPTAIKEFQWRNGWFVELSKQAAAAGQADPCPLHTSWLKEAGAL